MSALSITLGLLGKLPSSFDMESGALAGMFGRFSSVESLFGADSLSFGFLILNIWMFLRNISLRVEDSSRPLSRYTNHLKSLTACSLLGTTLICV